MKAAARLAVLGLALVTAGLAACHPPDDDDSAVDDGPGPLEHRFTFAVVADPHVVGEGHTHLDRLTTVVGWLTAEADARAIELVLVVGDVAWGEGMEPARAALDALPVPYVPLIGDNEIQSGQEEEYDQVFGPRFDALEPDFGAFERAPTPVWNPEHDQDSWFQNVTFEHRGVTFVGVDWAHRTTGSLLGESAELHDFDGGTWEHFVRWLDEVADDGPAESIVLASHHPMHLSPGAFSMDEVDRIQGVTGPRRDAVYGNFAGHYHFDAEETSDDGSYEIFVTDATWDDEITLRLVEVWGNEATFEYRHELVVL